jgi:hypothetical protein
MSNKFQILATISRIPLVTKEGVIDGNSVSPSSCCRKCKERSCLDNDSTIGKHNICPYDLSYNTIQFMDENLCLGGYINSSKNNKIGGPRRKDLVRLIADDHEIENTIKNIRIAEIEIKEIRQAATAETISFLHDVRTSLSLVMSSCERLISQARGATFAEKLRSADQDTFRLYQAIALLSDQLGLVDVLSNPESIAYGSKSRSDIVSSPKSGTVLK